MRVIFTLFFFMILVATVWFLNQKSSTAAAQNITVDSMQVAISTDTTSLRKLPSIKENVETATVSREAIAVSAYAPAPSNIKATQFVDYAKSFIGTPYVYGSTNPAVGFDCSGFINHVAKHFSLEVPRSSVQFTDLGKEVNANEAKPGDFILFTGTDASRRVVGHIGIITTNMNGELEFVHSTSGKAKGVTISNMSDHYKQRLVKVIRLLPEQTV